MIIFTHIAKTAGTSITQSIVKNFKNAYYADAIRQCIHPSIYECIMKNIPIQDRPDIIGGHMPYGIHNLFVGVECSYFTFLRHPVQRAISCFYHKNRNPVDTRSRRESILKKLQWCYQSKVNCNVMTRQLSGRDDLRKLILPNAVKHTGAIYHVGTRSIGYSAKEMRGMLKAAKYNLKHNYDFIGFQENSFSDMKRLCSQYGWVFEPSAVYLKSRTQFHPHWETEPVNNILGKMNRYDIQLYKFAKSL